MRILLSAASLAVGVAVGGAYPPVSRLVRTALAAAGMGETPPKVAAEKAASKPTAGEAGHAQGASETEEGIVRMTSEQAASQNISVAAVTGGTIRRHLSVPGTITTDTDRIARVPARVVGTVAEMRKRLGDKVEQGEVVAVLDSREVADAKSEYLTTAVRADLERINFDRQQALWDKRISAESVFLNAKAAYAEATLRQDLARQKLSALDLNAAEVAKLAKRDETTPTGSTLRQYALRSPLSGRIVERRVDVGAAVGKEGDPADVYVVADLSTVWIELAVPTVELAKVKDGARVVVAPGPGDDDGKRADGRVIFVSPLLNPETRSARVIVSLPNADFAWRPGTFVTAEVRISEDAVKAQVPKNALQTVEGRKVAFVRTEAGFEKRAVETGEADDDAIEITAGLRPGEEIAVANTFLLKAELGKGKAEHGH